VRPQRDGHCHRRCSARHRNLQQRPHALLPTRRLAFATFSLSGNLPPRTFASEIDAQTASCTFGLFSATPISTGAGTRCQGEFGTIPFFRKLIRLGHCIDPA
jgi:hypothetical protein